MGKSKGRKRDEQRATQAVRVGDPREAKLRELVERVKWDGDFRGKNYLQTQVEDRSAPDQPGFIVVVKEFFTRKECDQLMDIMEDVGLNQASQADKRK